MMNLLNKLSERFFPPIQNLVPGVHQYQAPDDASFPYRLHLRVEQTGNGTLIVNASTVLHLNQTATEYAYHLIKLTPDDELIRTMAKRYQVHKDQARQDHQDLIEKLLALVSTPDLDPVTFLGFERTEPYSGEITAPYRLDCALTYQLPAGEDKTAAPVERAMTELSTDEWKIVMENAWQAGIPHLIFTGGEPTLRADLVELIEHAEHLGQVTGLLTDGHKLGDSEYLQALLQSGLDHLMIVLDPDKDTLWETLDKVLHEDIHTTVHLTLTGQNADQFSEHLSRLTGLDLQALSLSTNNPALNETLQEIRNQAAVLGLSLVWDIPAPYSSFNPVALELGENEQQTSGAGSAYLYIEPDGDVLAAQGLPDVLGNMLSEPWGQIWQRMSG
jgi:organic radical activating enzyme